MWIVVLLCILTSVNANSVFRFGAALSTSGTRQHVQTTKNGYELYIKELNSRLDGRGFYVEGRRNTTGFYFQYEFIYKEDYSNHLLHKENVKELLEVDKVHFLGGSHQDYATEEMAMAAEKGVINYHCCVDPDSYYDISQPTVFGISASNQQFTKDFIRSIFLWNVTKLGFVYDEEDPLTKSTCEAAVGFFYDVMTPFDPNEISFVETFNSSRSSKEAIKKVAETAKKLKVESVIACLGMEDGKELVIALHDQRFSLKSLFITTGPTKNEWINSFDPDYLPNYIMSASQWNKHLKYPDEFFGSSIEYSELHEEAFGSLPNCNEAAASAVILTLTQAIKNAFRHCDISKTEGDVDLLLYDPDYISCHDGLVSRGYDRVVKALSLLDVETFFGRVKFNPYGRNIALSTVTTQVFERQGASGQVYREIEAVMPVSFASDLAVFPAENRYKDDCPPGYYIGPDKFDPCIPCKKGELSYSVNSLHCDECPLGAWAAEEGSSECVQCPFGTITTTRRATSQSECICMAGYYNPIGDSGVECTLCPDGTMCSGGTEQPVIREGYWSNFTLSHTVYQCDPPSVCKGGAIPTCEVGYSGRLCAECAPDYFGMFEKCYKCINSALIITLMLTVIVAWYFLNVTVSKSVASLEMILEWAQLANIIGDINLNWTPMLTTMFGVANFMDFDVDILEPSCLIKWGFKENFITQLLLPFVMSTMAAVGYLGSAAAYGLVKTGWVREMGKRYSALSILFKVPVNEKQLQVRWDSTVATFLASVDVMYVTISKYCFDVFKCEQIADASVLKEDVSVLCSTGEHKLLMALSCFGIVFYVIGFPVFVSWKLHDMKTQHTFSDSQNLCRFGFLYKKYEVDYNFTPAVIIIRKLLFVLVLVYVNNPAFQVGVLTVIINISLMIHVYSAPYVDTYLDVLFSFLLVSLMCEAFGGLMFYNSALSDENRRILEIIVTVSLLVLSAVFLIIFALEISKKFCIMYILRQHRRFRNRNSENPRNGFFSILRTYSKDMERYANSPMGSSREVDDICFELLDTFNPRLVYSALRNKPELIKDWDKLAGMLNQYMSDQSDTSYLSGDPIARFWRRLVDRFPELVDFLATTQEDKRRNFSTVITSLYRDFYLTNKVTPLPVKNIINWRDHAPMAQWLAIAPSLDRQFFINLISAMYRVGGKAEEADMLQSKLKHGGYDPQLEGRRRSRTTQGDKFLGSFIQGSNPLQHSAATSQSIRTAATVSLGVRKFQAKQNAKKKPIEDESQPSESSEQEKRDKIADTRPESGVDEKSM